MRKFKSLSTTVLLLSLFSCNNNNSSSSSAADSTSADTTKNTMMTMQPANNCATGDSSSLGYWQIDSLTAAAMITNVGSSGHPSQIKYDRPNIIQLIKDSFPGAQFQGWKSARYRDADTSRYCSKRCIPDTARRGKVAQYFTKILVVRRRLMGPAKDNAYQYFYFDCATICPPPDPCPSPNESDQ